MRLIDADELAEIYEYYEWEDALDVLNGAPTVDAEPVVRCKDCIYGQHSEGHEEMWYSCTYNYPWHHTLADDFCSEGKKNHECWKCKWCDDDFLCRKQGKIVDPEQEMCGLGEME